MNPHSSRPNRAATCSSAIHITGGVDNITVTGSSTSQARRNKGFDVAAQWHTTLPWGELGIETQHTFQEEDVLAYFAQTPEDLNGLLGDPEWVGHLNLTFSRGSMVVLLGRPVHWYVFEP